MLLRLLFCLVGFGFSNGCPLLMYPIKSILSRGALSVFERRLKQISGLALELVGPEPSLVRLAVFLAPAIPGLPQRPGLDLY